MTRDIDKNFHEIRVYMDERITELVNESNSNTNLDLLLEYKGRLQEVGLLNEFLIKQQQKYYKK